MAEKTTLHRSEKSELQPASCRAARGLLDWTQEDLAVAAGVCRSTVRDFEKGRHGLQQGSLAAILKALETAGIELVSAPDCIGVQLRMTGDAGPRTPPETS